MLLFDDVAREVVRGLELSGTLSCVTQNGFRMSYHRGVTKSILSFSVQMVLGRQYAAQ